MSKVVCQQRLGDGHFHMPPLHYPQHKRHRSYPTSVIAMEHLYRHSKQSILRLAGQYTTKGTTLLDRYNHLGVYVSTWTNHNLHWKHPLYLVYLWDGDWTMVAVTGGLCWWQTTTSSRLVTFAKTQSSQSKTRRFTFRRSFVSPSQKPARKLWKL